MTITTILNAVALGSTSEQRTASPTKTVMQAGTTQIVLNARVTLNGSNVNPGDRIKIYYAVSPFALTADVTLPQVLGNQVQSLDISVAQIGTDRIFTTGLKVGEIMANNGGNLYTWYDSPALQGQSPAVGSVATLTLTSVELP